MSTSDGQNDTKKFLAVPVLAAPKKYQFFPVPALLPNIKIHLRTVHNTIKFHI
jgi:hypothetical protein